MAGIELSGKHREAHIFNSRTTLLLIAVILLVGVLLRFFWLGRWSMWTDELYTWRIVQNLRILQDGVPDDQHPPLYHLLMAMWLQIDDRETWLRLPSALAGAAVIPLMAGAGILLGGRRFGVITAALAATSPLLIWYAREMRMYGLATFFWALAILFFLMILLRGSWWASIGLALANLLGLYSTYSTLGLIVLQVIFSVPLWVWRGQRQWKRLIYLLVAFALTLAGFIPWMPFFKQQISREAYRFNWPIPWDSSRTFDINLEQTLLIAAVIGAIGALLLWLALGSVWRSYHLRMRLLDWVRPISLIVTLAFLFIFLLGAYPRGLTLRRQILVFWPVVLIFGAWALYELRQRWMILLICILGILASGWLILGEGFEDWRGTTAYLYANAATDERVFYQPTWAKMSLEYYDHQTVNLAKGQPQLADPPLATGETVWYVVNQHPQLQTQTQEADGWLRQNATLVSEARFARHIAVQEFQID
jgi:uncharacterized membrane protein